MTFVIIWVW